MGSCHRSQRRICAKERQDLSIVKSRKRGGARIREGLVEEGVYQAIEITTDVTGILCAKERWEEEDGAQLLVSEQLDNQEQLSTATDFGSDRQYWKEEGIYKDGSMIGM